MALVKCPECGREKVSDTAVACPDCGYAIKEYYAKVRYEEEQKILQEKLAREEEERKKQSLIEAKRREEKEKIEREEAEKKRLQLEKERKSRNKKITIITSIIMFVIIVIGIIDYVENNIIIPRNDYEQAEQLFKKGDYEEAQVVFEDLGDYNNSIEMVEKCKFEIIKNNVELGNELVESLEYINSIEFTDDVSFIKGECLFKLAKNALACSDYSKAITYIDMIEDSDYLEKNKTEIIGILDKARSQCAKEQYEKGEFDLAIGYYEKITNLLPDDERLYNNAIMYNKVQGMWQDDEYEGSWYVYSGWDLTMYRKLPSYPVTSQTIEDLLKEYEVNGSILQSNYLTMEIISENKIARTSTEPNHSYRVEYSRVNSVPEVEEKSTVEPKIGMTCDEVKKSSWGDPQDINKTTYTWGIKEQWCYSGNRYIYFEDGIVTAISE